MEQVTMAQYRIDGDSTILTTSAPDDGTRWNGWACPTATANEYRAYSDAALANGSVECFRVMRFDDRMALVFPCADSQWCNPGSDDVHALEDGWHFHMEDIYSAVAATDDVPVRFDGLVWLLVETCPASPGGGGQCEREYGHTGLCRMNGHEWNGEPSED